MDGLPKEFINNCFSPFNASETLVSSYTDQTPVVMGSNSNTQGVTHDHVESANANPFLTLAA